MTNEEMVIKYKEGDKSQLEKLYQKNLGVIRNNVLKCSIGQKQDLMQESFFALVKALETYNPNGGSKFITWLRFYIGNTCKTYMRKNVMGLGTKHYYRMIDNREDMQTINDQIHLRKMVAPISLSHPVIEGGENFSNMIAKSYTTDISVARVEANKVLKEVISKLKKDSYKEIMTRYLGLEGAEPESIPAIAKSMGVTKQNICEIASRAKKHIATEVKKNQHYYEVLKDYYSFM